MNKKEDAMFRNVTDYKRLSGHKQEGAQMFPSICFSDGEGPGGGSALCSIESFHWADVSQLTRNRIELKFENKATMQFVGGLVQYDDGVWPSDSKDEIEPQPNAIAR